MAICPAGPPKLTNPNLSQKPNACQKLTDIGRDAFCEMVDVFFMGLFLK
jgi:hypothetical protein